MNKVQSTRSKIKLKHNSKSDDMARKIVIRPCKIDSLRHFFKMILFRKYKY